MSAWEWRIRRFELFNPGTGDTGWCWRIKYRARIETTGGWVSRPDWQRFVILGGFEKPVDEIVVDAIERHAEQT